MSENNKISIGITARDEASPVLDGVSAALHQATGETRSATESTERLTRAQKTLIDSVRRQAETVGMSRSELLSHRAAQLGVSTQTQDHIRTIAAHEAALKNNTQSLGLGTRAMGFMKNGVSELKGQVAALAAVIGLGMFAGMVKGAIDAADHINDLSARTGLGVAELSRLEYIAKMSGTEMETLTKGVGKLSIAMVDAKNGTGDTAEVFKRLGISVVDSTGAMRPQTAVMGDLADKFQGMQDGAGKTALAVKLFGKTGADLIPVLNLGKKGIADLAAESDALGNTLDDTATKAMADFNDQFDRAEIAGKAMVRQLAAALLPAMKGVADQVVEVAKNMPSLGTVTAGVLSGMLKGWTYFTAGPQMAWIDTKEVFFKGLDGMVKPFLSFLDTVAGMYAFLGADQSAAVVTTLSERLRGLTDRTSELNAQRQQLLASTRGEINNITEITEAMMDEAEAAAHGKGALNDVTDAANKNRDASDALKQANKTAAEEAKKLAEEYAKLKKPFQEKLDLLRQELALGRELTEAEKVRIKLLNDVRATKVKLTDAMKAELYMLVQNTQHSEKLRKEQENQKQAVQDLIEAKKKEHEAGEESIKAVQGELDKLTEEIDTLGLSETARAQRAAALAREKYQLELLNHGPMDDYVQQLARELDLKERIADIVPDKESKQKAIDEAKEVADAWKKNCDDINNNLTDALMRGFESGKGFGQNLKDTLVNTFKTMVLRPMLSAVVSPASNMVGGMVNNLLGGVGLGGGNTMLGGQGGGLLGNISSLGSMWNSLSSGASQAWNSISNGASTVANWIGLGSAAMATASTAVAAGSAAAAAGASAATGAVAAAHAAAGAAGAAGASGAAAGASAFSVVPVIGWVVAIAAIAYSIFGGHKGGPKTGGSYVADFAADGAETKNSLRLYTPSDQDSQAQKSVRSLADQIKTVSTDLGGAAKAIKIGIGFDADPQGKANSRATLLFESAQRRVNITEDAGRDDKSLTEALALQSSRALLLGLQASDLPREIAAVLNGIDAASASQEVINNAISQAQAIATYTRTVRDAFVELGHSFPQLAGLSQTARESITGLAGGLEALTGKIKTYYDLYYSDAEKSARDIGAVDASLKAMGLTLGGSKEALRHAVEAQDLSTEGGRKTYAALLELAPAFASALDKIRAQAETEAKARLGAAATPEAVAAAVQQVLDHTVLGDGGDVAALGGAVASGMQASADAWWAKYGEAINNQNAAAAAQQRALDEIAANTKNLPGAIAEAVASALTEDPRRRIAPAPGRFGGIAPGGDNNSEVG